MLCEDLGGNYSNREDFDYNDVVFDANLWEEVEWKKVTITTKTVITTRTTIYEVGTDGKIVQENGQNKVARVEESSETKIEETTSTSQVEGVDPVYYAEICLIATGATLPVKVGGPDAIEVHKAFGDYSVDCMINTFDQYTSEVKNGFGYHVVAEPVRLDWIDVTKFMKTMKTISDIPVYVQWTGIEAQTVTADKGSAPGRFTVRDKINWASERANINVGYGNNFTNWVEGSSSNFWSGVDPHNTGLYQGYPSPSAGLTFNPSQVNVETTLAVHRTTYETQTIQGETVETNNLSTDNNNNNNNKTIITIKKRKGPLCGMVVEAYLLVVANLLMPRARPYVYMVHLPTMEVILKLVSDLAIGRTSHGKYLIGEFNLIRSGRIRLIPVRGTQVKAV